MFTVQTLTGDLLFELRRQCPHVIRIYSGWIFLIGYQERSLLLECCVESQHSHHQEVCAQRLRRNNIRTFIQLLLHKTIHALQIGKLSVHPFYTPLPLCNVNMLQILTTLGKTLCIRKGCWWRYTCGGYAHKSYRKAMTNISKADLNSIHKGLLQNQYNLIQLIRIVSC